jgi:hypothetical protein
VFDLTHDSANGVRDSSPGFMRPRDAELDPSSPSFQSGPLLLRRRGDLRRLIGHAAAPFASAAFREKSRDTRLRTQMADASIFVPLRGLACIPRGELNDI